MKDNKIIIMLQGGIGNQLFCYAHYKYLKLIGIDVLLDKSAYLKRKRAVAHDTFKLDCFNTDTDCYADDALLKKIGFANDWHYSVPLNEIIKKLYVPKNTIFFVKRVIRKLLELCRINQKIDRHIYEESIHGKFFFDNLKNINKSYYVVTVFASYKHIGIIRESLLRDFALKIPLDPYVEQILYDIKSCNSVALHIRRGDAIGHPLLNPCGIHYYKSAVRILLKKYSYIQFFLFSNDLNYAKEEFSFIEHKVIVDTSYCEKYSSCFDLLLMSNAKHNIVAKSTFSFWGAWLNENKNKTVICPSEFMGNCVTANDIYPPEWIRVNLN
ncbi:MAG: alpha-1,2-fucosyltransferase [Helicobacteraceae bacterium]|jgi:hypothetical protein|nr:alpha-1,2-fucosyltransferase [Helicobacteraceae bacterium]